MANHKIISPKDAQALLASGEAILVDVREPDEFKSKHIAYGQSIPLSKIDQLPKFMKFGQDKKIIFQCLRGKRAEQACVITDSNIIKNEIYNMDGGINAWENAGLPLITSNGSNLMSIFRQLQVIIGSVIVLFVLLGTFCSPWFYAGVGLIGAAFALAGMIGLCPAMLLLKKMPWNKGA